jgi:hypothetical protein
MRGWWRRGRSARWFDMAEMGLLSQTVLVLIWTTVVIIVIPLIFRLFLKKYRISKIFSLEELRAIGKFGRSLSFILFVFYLMEGISGLIFGTTLLEKSPMGKDSSIHMVVSSFFFLFLFFVPRFFFSISTARDVAEIKEEPEAKDHIFSQTGKSGVRSLDSIDMEILGTIKSVGGDIEDIKSNLKWLDEDKIESKLRKLLLLQYINIIENMFILTADGLDVLNLPPVLFMSSIDRKITQKLSEIRVQLKREDSNGTVAECGKLLEEVLRKRLDEKGIKTIKDGKPIEKATFGEMIGSCRDNEIIDPFQYNVLSAANEIRKSIHAKDGKIESISVEKAYFVYTLTEIGVISLSNTST